MGLVNRIEYRSGRVRFRRKRIILTTRRRGTRNERSLTDREILRVIKRVEIYTHRSNYFSTSFKFTSYFVAHTLCTLDTNWNLNGPVDSIRDKSEEAEQRKMEAVGELVNGIGGR